MHVIDHIGAVGERPEHGVGIAGVDIVGDGDDDLAALRLKHRGTLQATPDLRLRRAAVEFQEDHLERRTGQASWTSTVPAWVITTISVVIATGLWEFFGRDVNPLLGTYPSAIIKAFFSMLQTGRLQDALIQSSQPFMVGYIVAAIVGIPVGLLLGRYRILEFALGIYVTAGYATPLIALVPLLILWFGLGFMVKAVVVFLLSFFPICINTWFGVKSFVVLYDSINTSVKRDKRPSKAWRRALSVFGGQIDRAGLPLQGLRQPAGGKI